eukprot:GHVU01079341.1.p1 GENE.GHVU01079341.1~~GHVU01079341.1.p1  ORF type:complete len:287 (+),score=17.53 GHVU01079341.1:119-862(+)
MGTAAGLETPVKTHIPLDVTFVVIFVTLVAAFYVLTRSNDPEVINDGNRAQSNNAGVIGRLTHGVADTVGHICRYGVSTTTAILFTLIYLAGVWCFLSGEVFKKQRFAPENTCINATALRDLDFYRIFFHPFVTSGTLWYRCLLLPCFSFALLHYAEFVIGAADVVLAFVFAAVTVCAGVLWSNPDTCYSGPEGLLFAFGAHLFALNPTISPAYGLAAAAAAAARLVGRSLGSPLGTYAGVRAGSGG